MVNWYINKELNKVAKTYKVKITGLTDVLGNVTELNIKEIFGNFGDIELVEVPRDPMSGKNYGYAMVVYTKKKDALDAIESMHKHKLKGKEIHVEMVEEDDELDPGSIKVLAPPSLLPAQQSSNPPSICLLINNMFDDNSHEKE